MSEMFRLPDLPNAGYATMRAKQLSDTVQEFMRGVERDRLRLLTIVIEGPEKWRRVAGSVLLFADDQLLDEIFRYFELQACRPFYQVQLLDAAKNRDKWREIMTAARPDIESQQQQLRVIQKWKP